MLNHPTIYLSITYKCHSKLRVHSGQCLCQSAILLVCWDCDGFTMKNVQGKKWTFPYIFQFFHLYIKLLKSWWLSCLRNPHKRQFPTCFPMFHIVFPQFLQAFPMSPLVSLPVFLILGLTHFLLILHACSEWPYSSIFKNITEKDQPKALSGMCYF